MQIVLSVCQWNLSKSFWGSCKIQGEVVSSGTLETRPLWYGSRILRAVEGKTLDRSMSEKQLMQPSAMENTGIESQRACNRLSQTNRSCPSQDKGHTIVTTIITHRKEILSASRAVVRNETIPLLALGKDRDDKVPG